MVQQQHSFQGRLPLARMKRLATSLAGTDGEAVYQLDFDRDNTGMACLRVRVEAGLPLLCQRTLDVFVQPVSLDQRLGLIADESDEAALPEGFEPLLISDHQLRLADVIEDELILALPLVPLSPGAPLDYNEYEAGADAPTSATQNEAGGERENPFAILSSLKTH